MLGHFDFESVFYLVDKLGGNTHEWATHVVKDVRHFAAMCDVAWVAVDFDGEPLRLIRELVMNE
eukprot:10124790-Alexandrium_andersonii.AAC.1